MTEFSEVVPNSDPAAHKSLAGWAAECAERTLPIFEQAFPDDDRPRAAIVTLRGWVNDELPMTTCRAAAFAAHAAARDAAKAEGTAAVAAARAAGQAAAVAHMAAHSEHAALYAAKAVALHGSGEPSRTAERRWQWENLAPALRPVGFPKGLK